MKFCIDGNNRALYTSEKMTAFCINNTSSPKYGKNNCRDRKENCKTAKAPEAKISKSK